MAVKLGLDVAKSITPSLWGHLEGVYKAVRVSLERGYQLTARTPLVEIEVCYRAYYYNGDLEEFIDLFRACERIIDATRNNNINRDKDRQPQS